MARAIDADLLKEVLEKNFGHTGGADVLRQLIDAQPTIEPKQEWISVKDRLPEQYAVVIVYDGEQVGEAEFNGVDFGWVESEDLAFATHWMPFPEPPEKNNEEEQA